MPTAMLPPNAGQLLCRRCDVFVGYGAAGVVERPTGTARDVQWLKSHCWMCERSREEIEQTQTLAPRITPLDHNKRQNEFNEAVRVFAAEVLAFHDHELVRVNQALSEAGIDYPQGSLGVRDLAIQRDTQPDAVLDRMKDELEDERKRTDPGRSSNFIAGMQYMINFLEEQVI